MSHVAVALLALQASWSVVALTADAMGVPGARDWCPIVSDALGFKAAVRAEAHAHEPPSDARGHDHPGAHHSAHHHGAAPASDAAPMLESETSGEGGHGAHHGAHECPAYAAKLVELSDPSRADWSIIRIALAHAYATRDATLRTAQAARPPTGVRGPPTLI